MPFVRVNVKRCVQDSPEYGSTDEHMVSRVFYSIDVDGVPKGDYYSDIKQVVGSAYSSANMEVTPPHGYRGPYDHNIFSNEVARYFCKLVSSRGAMFSLGGATNVRMRNNTSVIPYHFQFDAEGPAANW
jgi:hypothetical protein